MPLRVTLSDGAVTVEPAEDQYMHSDSIWEEHIDMFRIDMEADRVMIR
jgi:hypothetical protein